MRLFPIKKCWIVFCLYKWQTQYYKYFLCDGWHICHQSSFLSGFFEGHCRMLILRHRRNGLMRTAQWCTKCPDQWHHVVFNNMVDPPLSLFCQPQSIQRHNQVIPPPRATFYCFCHLRAWPRSGAFKGLSFRSRWRVCIQALNMAVICLRHTFCNCQLAVTLKTHWHAILRQSWWFRFAVCGLLHGCCAFADAVW